MTNERLFFNFVNYIEIEISSLCNRNCTYCPQSLSKRKRELLPLHIIKKIANELKKIDYHGGIAFHQFNEPLLEKEHLFSCINIMKKTLPRAKLVLYTNGDFLTRKTFVQLKRAGINEFHISCHANDTDKWNRKEAYQRVKQMRKKIHYSWGNFKIGENSVEYSSGKLIVWLFKNIEYQFIKARRYPLVVIINDVNYFADGSKRMGTITSVNTNNHEEQFQSYFCQSIIHCMHISYKGNAYLCWDNCEGIESVKKYSLGSIYNNDIFELYRKKCVYVQNYLFGDCNEICKRCFWNQ